MRKFLWLAVSVLLVGGLAVATRQPTVEKPTVHAIQEMGERPQSALPSTYHWSPPDSMAAEVLFCVRSYEATANTEDYGGYDGVYDGPYQYHPDTWRTWASAVHQSRLRDGYVTWTENYAAMPAFRAPPAVQHEVSWYLWNRKPSSWPQGDANCHPPKPRANSAARRPT